MTFEGYIVLGFIVIMIIVLAKEVMRPWFNILFGGGGINGYRYYFGRGNSIWLFK